MRRNDMNDTTEIVKYGVEEFHSTVQELKNFTANVTAMAQSATNATDSAANLVNAVARVWESDRRYEVICKKIAADKEKFHEFLSKTFDKRDKAIDTLIDQIENGVNQNNTELLLEAMRGLATVASSSPWPNFADFKRMIDAGEGFVIE
jgi:phage-related protein